MTVKRLFVLLFVLTFVLAACGTTQPTTSDEPAQQETPVSESVGSGDEPAEGQAEPEPAEEEPEEAEEPEPAPETDERHGGTFVVALGSDPEHLNTSISSSVPVGLAAGAVTEGLLRIGRDYQLYPLLAESWDISDNGLVYTFHLRQGVTWHDGQPFTSADVKFTMEVVSPLHSRAGAVLENAESIETPDDHTVVITLRESFAPFLQILTSENAGIQPKHIYEGTEILDNPANLAPIGTGPYRFVSWTPGQTIEMERNEDYWGAPAPFVDRLVFQIIPDNSSRILALEAGTIDYISNYDMNYVDAPRVDANPDIHVEYDRGHPRVLLLFFNMEVEPLNSVEVRQALFSGLDRELILESAYGGIGTLGQSSIPPGIVWAYNPAVDYMEMYPYDIEAANALLDQAGYERAADGTRFEIRFLYDPAQPGFPDLADILRSNWSDLGVTVTLEPRERAVWLEQLYVQKDYDTAIAFYTTSGDPTLGIQRAYLCDEIREASFTNASQYCNEEVDALFAEGTRAVTYEERAEYYYQAQEIIAQALPAAVVINSGYVDAIRGNFGGVAEFFDSPESTSPQWDKIYLDD